MKTNIQARVPKKKIGAFAFCKRILKNILTFYFAFVACFSYSQQSKIDSLKRVLQATEKDTDRIKILTSLCWKFKDMANYEEALKYANEGLNICEKINDENGIATFNRVTGIVFSIQGNYFESSKKYSVALNGYEKTNNKKGIGDVYRDIGINYLYQDNYAEALEKFLSAIKIFTECKDTLRIADCSVTIGTIYHVQGNFSEGLKNYNSALKIFEEHGDKIGMSQCYNNIGLIYKDLKQYDEALKNFNAVLKIGEERMDKMGIANSYNNIGIAYHALSVEAKSKHETEKSKLLIDKALNSHLAALKIREEIKEGEGIARSYKNIGNAYKELGNYSNAIIYLKEGLDRSKALGNKNLISETCLYLSDIYFKKQDFKNAYEYYYLYTQYTDSIFNEESSKQIAEMQTKYETEKKEQQIELLNKDKEVAETESKRKNLILLFIAAVAIAIGVIAMIIFRSLRVTKRQNVVIEKQKLLVDEKNRHIEEKQKEIIDSITYAKRLQQAILPPTDFLKKYLPESFILYNPKDIVAGDFYWMDAITADSDTIIFIAAADCTGHGVPGAMVSVVCSNALNRAVKEFNLRETGKILDKVTDLVLETFEKSEEQIKDGMDISLLSIKFQVPSPKFQEEKKKDSADDLEIGNWNLGLVPYEVQWSGANNPLWYISNGQITEVKADKQPVGKFDIRKPFTTHTIELPSSDFGLPTSFYLFTDGLPDQFGGPKGKKFMYKRFENNLSDISKLPMNEQQMILEKAFQDWKGNLEQVDDVTVIGIKI